MGSHERRRIRGWDEQAVHTGWRRVLIWRPREVSGLKRRTRRRERRERDTQDRRAEHTRETP